MFHVRYGAKRPWPDPTSCCLPVSQGVHRWEALERRRDGSSRGASAAAATGRGPVGRPHGCPCCAGQRTRGWRSRLLWQELACPHGGGCQASLGHLCTPQVSRQHPRPGDLFARSCSGVTSHRRAGRPRAPTAGGGCPHVLPAIPACPHCPRQLLPQRAASRNAAAAQRGDAQRRRVCRITTITPARFLLFLFFSVGQVVNIKAKVNRAFNSSMEVGVPPPAVTPTPAPIPPSPVQPSAPRPRCEIPKSSRGSQLSSLVSTPSRWVWLGRGILGGMRVPGERSRLSGVLCPLPGGHPGELRGPVQREALQHLQGVRHFRGAGPLRQQGERRPAAAGVSVDPCLKAARKRPLWGEASWAGCSLPSRHVLALRGYLHTFGLVMPYAVRVGVARAWRAPTRCCRPLLCARSNPVIFPLAPP